jgi:NhaP-type Na+/H+ and K+/H+ antiporter
MKNLFQKVLEVKEHNNHSVDDINIVVKSTLKNLNNQYRKGQNKKKIEDTYISEEYKVFITYLKNDSKELDRLFTECIIDETRIANFVKGDTKRPHNKTKDFFAVYCGYEGYKDFTANNNQPREEVKSKSENKSNISITVNQFGENTNVEKIKTKKLYL